MNLAQFHLPDSLFSVCQRLRNHGYQVYLVGGAVRDALLGFTCQDFDLASNACVQQVQQLFPVTLPTGLKHGTVTIRYQGLSYEITSFRVDGSYSDARHPDSVRFTDNIEADLARRDFTMNAMAYEPFKRVLIDPFNGCEHLLQGMIVAVGNSAQRLQEDALRMMRACRFAAQLNFNIHRDLKKALQQLAPRLVQVSPPRLFNEWQKILISPFPVKGLQILVESRLLYFLLEPLAGKLSLAKLKKSEALWSQCPANLASRLTFLLLLCNMLESAELVKIWKILPFTKKQQREVCAHCQAWQLLQKQFKQPLTPLLVRSFLARCQLEYFENFTSIARLILQAEEYEFAQEFFQLAQQQLAFQVPLKVEQLDIDGHHLCQTLNLAPGSWLGKLLQNLLEHVLEFPLDNKREKLINLAKQFHEEQQTS